MANRMSKLVCGLTAFFVFLDPVPSIPMEQQHQKSTVSALPPSPVGDVKPATHLVPLEKLCELGTSGESHIFSFFLPYVIFSAQWRGSALPWFSDQASGTVKLLYFQVGFGHLAQVIGVGRS